MMQLSTQLPRHTFAESFEVHSIRTTMNRTFPLRFGEVIQEVEDACDQYLGTEPNGQWQYYTPLSLL